MKFAHLSDLHLGKRVNEFSMLEDQQYILKEILEILEAEAVDGVLIAGDVYDKSVPPAEAVALFDRFLWELSQRKLPVYIVSGNHDSPERLAFGGRLLERSGVYLSPVYDGGALQISLSDAFGPLVLTLLPFLKPAHVRRFFPEEPTGSYTEALRTALAHIPLDPEQRNVLVTHQFVTGASRSESEELSVGGADNVDAAVFEAFDYVALGHIHGPQSVERETLRYCGTPLKYSFSEAGHQKSLTLVELREKGSVRVWTVPLRPQHDLRELRGTYEALTFRKNYEGTPTDDYVHITLTDQEDVPNALEKLRVIYPNLMKLDYDNARTRAAGRISDVQALERKSPLALFEEFYAEQNGQPMTPEQRAFSAGIMEEIWEDRL